MFRAVALAAVSAGFLATAACAPISSYSGYQAIESDPKDVKVGVDTMSTVRGKLGSPSAVSTFDKDVWFYMNQMKERVAFRRPQVVARNITAITFNKDSEVVESVKNFTLKDGKTIAYNDRETPTRGREITILEQMLGAVGHGGILPRDQEEQGVPGNRPGDQRP
jgi:outer membrane protein assembly factor BamE (lipoprotein component of BamABCDE complex)